jgi:hypothetical protein
MSWQTRLASRRTSFFIRFKVSMMQLDPVPSTLLSSMDSALVIDSVFLRVTGHCRWISLLLLHTGLLAVSRQHSPKIYVPLAYPSNAYSLLLLRLGITFTYAGLKTNNEARVLNNEGLTMPGLWAVGEISGGFFAFNYPGGAGLTKGAVFGRIAGQAAAKAAKMPK